MRLSIDSTGHTPTEIKLQQRSRIIKITFDNGECFQLPCEYLRVYTPSAEALGHAVGQETLQVGKQEVNISAIQAVGNYGIQPTFTDGHNSGIYSWDMLYKLGSEYDRLWANYIKKLDKTGQTRQALH